MHPILRTAFAAVSLFVSSSLVSAADLKPLLDDSTLWSQNREAFGGSSAKLGFEWTSNLRDSSRSDSHDLTFLDNKVYESVARFEGDELKQVTVLFFGRGDAGDLSKAAFEELLRKTIAALDGYTGKKFTARGKDSTSAVKADGVTWQTDHTLYTLEYSFTKENKAKKQEYRAEFIRLEMTRPPEAKKFTASSASKPAGGGKADLRTRVTRDTASGDVFIGTVPMVDQGQKGYCAVACAERILRYYGVEVDANEMAQVANTATAGGTSSRAMFEALKKLTARFRVRTQAMEEMSTQDYIRLIGDYNRNAKKAKKSLLTYDDHMIDVPALYQEMDADVLKETRAKNASSTSKFLREIQNRIDTGVPLIWSVHLGLFPEPGVPQSGGGHKRPIICYNTKSNEVIFSDSWGAGHEKKRMALDNAWTITTGLTAMEPIGG